jgi:hypothetical protein
MTGVRSHLWIVESASGNDAVTVRLPSLGVSVVPLFETKQEAEQSIPKMALRTNQKFIVRPVYVCLCEQMPEHLEVQS